MKVKPMIFNTDMVRALMDGRKGQTRRPIAFPVKFCERSGFSFMDKLKKWWACGIGFSHSATVHNFVKSKSPWQVGDLIYVRERFCIGGIDETDREHPNDRQQFVHQDGTGHPIPYEACIRKAILMDEVVWKPSIHMPRIASRITLKVTGVRVERVQDISEEDAIAEGFPSSLHHLPAPHVGSVGSTATEAFHKTWQKIYSDYWDKNGWCWVIDFDVIHQNVDAYLKTQEAA